MWKCVPKRTLRVWPRDRLIRILMWLWTMELHRHLNRVADSVLQGKGRRTRPSLPRRYRDHQTAMSTTVPKWKGPGKGGGYICSSGRLWWPCLVLQWRSRVTTDNMARTVLGVMLLFHGSRGQNIEPKRIILKPQGLMLFALLGFRLTWNPLALSFLFLHFEMIVSILCLSCLCILEAHNFFF